MEKHLLPGVGALAGHVAGLAAVVAAQVPAAATAKLKSQAFRQFYRHRAAWLWALAGGRSAHVADNSFI